MATTREQTRRPRRADHILAVGGSRTLADERVKILLLEHIDAVGPLFCVSTHAEPEGVCEVVRKVCHEMGIPLLTHSLDFKWRAGAFMHRSLAVLRDADSVLFVHDGKSKGTANEIAQAEAMGVKCTVEILEPTPYKKSVGFTPATDTEWATPLADWDEIS